MFSSRLFRRRAAALGAGVAVTALALTACSTGSSDNVPGGDDTSDASSVEEMLANAPVADESLFTPGSTMEKIRERGTLIVAEALDAPLLSQQDPTNPENVSGFDAYLAQLLSVYIFGEPSVEIVPPASETREALLQNGTVDVVFNTYTITEERAEQVSFAGPYFNSGLAVAVPADNDEINGIDDLGGKTVIVGANTPAVTAVPEAQPTAELIDFATDPQAVQALLQGRGDAYVQDYVLLASNAANNDELKVVGQPFTEEPYGIGLQHGDEEFKKFINDWLLEIQESGEWGQAWELSLGTVVESEIPTPPSIGSVPGS
ncbi:glutamate ABC transporter substrate-binding protein [Salinibacterium sp. SYSU T00001]|uniref:glutamate ABC transporter substrate-binding protein n=1 Tax=Homoserinimonas sedimenticola TaxID=2986805 RepID=UPI002235BD9A|nr:glutamate ABC transporter substrate-binding protein [Salinibacterium sedimenticola]MCW4385258.1 glutamate ABC transporter substrate-binding protein [Salinibacterium sedimenticola]